MASCSFTSTGRKFTLNVTEVSYSIENNTSTIYWDINISGGGTQWYDSYCKATVNGLTVYNETKSWSSGVFPAKDGSASGYIYNVTHDSEGKASVSFGIEGYSEIYSTQSSSGTLILTTIPRASDIAVSNTELGQNVPIVIGKKVSSFTSTLSYTIGSLTGTIVDKTSLSNYPWVMESTLINQIKNAYPNSGSYAKGGIEAKVICKTYNRATLIGTKEASFKLYIVDKPTISGATRAELNTNILAQTTNVLRHASQNKFTITATAPTGASIVSYRVRNGTQDSGTSTSNIVNLNDIQEYYEENNALKTKFIVTCIDSRGNESDEYSVVCDFINYIPVSINKTDVTLKRSTGTSTDCKLYAIGNFYNGKFGSTNNVIIFTYRPKLQTPSTCGNWTTIPVTYTDNTFKINNQAISGTFDYAENYDFELMATDKIGDTDDYALVFATSVAIAKYHKNGADFSGLSVNGYIVPYFTVEEDWQE